MTSAHTNVDMGKHRTSMQGRHLYHLLLMHQLPEALLALGAHLGQGLCREHPRHAAGHQDLGHWGARGSREVSPGTQGQAGGSADLTHPTQRVGCTSEKMQHADRHTL